MWIGTANKGCCHDQIGSAMWIGKDATGSIHDIFEIICDLEVMIEVDVMN
jgi:hypothetical protein